MEVELTDLYTMELQFLTKRPKKVIVEEDIKKLVGTMSHMTPLSVCWEFTSGLRVVRYRIVSIPSSQSCCETCLRYDFRGDYSSNVV